MWRCPLLPATMPHHYAWHLLNAIFVSNGLYDLCCGMAVLANASHPLAYLHAAVFRAVHQPPRGSLSRRFMGYWILTYAGPRLAAGLWGPRPELDMVCAYTYLIEGMAYHAENWRFGTASAGGVALVSGASYGLAMASAWRSLAAL